MFKAYAKTVLFMIVVALLSACDPAAMPASPTLTAAPPSPTAAPLTATPVPPTTIPPTAAPPTGTPIPPTATPSPTATPMPTATASPTPMVTETSRVTLYPEPGIRIDIRTDGERDNDWGYDILLLDDGGALIVGQADNTGPSHRITPGKARLIRTDAEGNVLWQKDYGGEKDSMFYSPIQTGDNEYVILGQIAASYTRDEEDIYLVKIDGEGNEIWSHTYGGQGMDIGKMVRQTADGGFILVGDRADAYPRDGLYQSNLVLIKTDAEGNEVWTHTYGDKILYLGWGVAQTPDGGYILTGWEAKTIPDRDVIAIKTDAAGEVEWTRTWDLDPGDRDGGFDMILTADGYVVIAGIKSMDSGRRGAVLIKVDLEGNEIWVKEYDTESEGAEFWDVMEDTDGGYVMAGDRFLSEINRATGEAARAGLIIKTNPDGEVLWQRAISSGEYDSLLLSSAVVLPGRGYIFVGGARPHGKRYEDMVWVKLTTDETPMSATKVTSSNAYLGQIPPRLTPQVFAPGIVSIPDTVDYAGSFSPDGAEFYFTRGTETGQNIYETRLSDGVWSEPAPIAFSAGYNAHEPHVTFDNQTLYFGWFRPPPPGEKSTMPAGIWATDRTASGWASPRYVGEGMAVSSDRSGQMYVTNVGTRSVGQVTVTDGRFTDWKLINAGAHPCIAPDGSYLLYDRDGTHLFIKFRLADGKWSTAKDLTQHGMPVKAGIASISPDGKYLFYGYRGDLYWVSTDLITDLKDK